MCLQYVCKTIAATTAVARAVSNQLRPFETSKVKQRAYLTEFLFNFVAKVLGGPEQPMVFLKQVLKLGLRLRRLSAN